MKHTAARTALILILGGMLMFGLSGCAKKYYVDFNGSRSAHRAGREVVLHYGPIPTDTDYTFYKDGEPLPYVIENEKITLRFTMPAHDVTVTVTSRNSMVDEPETQPEPETSSAAPETETAAVPQKEVVLSFHSFDGGGPTFSVILDDPAALSYKTEQKYSSPHHAEMDGAGFTVYITLKGLKPGETAFTVVSDSPITGTEEMRYVARVYEDLSLTVTPAEASPEEP